nr:glutamate cyclase domain-containing protein [Rhodococcus sp. (in: high G+C Gram-positive bacteria)]
MPEIVGHYIDRIMSTELRPIGNMPRGVAHLLYDAVRAKADAPLSTTMARALIDRLGPGDRIVIVCGAGGAPTLPTGEIDGLLGAVALARALTLGVGADVHLAVEPRFVAPITSIARAGELNVRTDPHEEWTGSIAIHISPEDDAEGITFAEQLLDNLEPTAVLAIEKLSINYEGIIHGATGIPWHDVHFNAAHLFALAAERGVLTCGIGDAGNEIGFGSIPEVAAIQPEGKVMGSSISVDVLLAAAISDWGGYAVTAMLAFLLERPDLVADADYVENLLRAAVASGVVCGWYARPTLSDDGVPLAAQRAAATLIETAVTQALTRAHSPSH